jgi:hypothetical protein
MTKHSDGTTQLTLLVFHLFSPDFAISIYHLFYLGLPAVSPTAIFIISFAFRH